MNVCHTWVFTINQNSNGIMNTTYATSEELQNDCYIRKIGKIVWINYSSDIKSIQKGTWTKIFDVPEEYKPFAQCCEIPELIRSPASAIVHCLKSPAFSSVFYFEFSQFPS